jgi:hypothetical protein
MSERNEQQMVELSGQELEQVQGGLGIYRPTLIFNIPDGSEALGPRYGAGYDWKMNTKI